MVRGLKLEINIPSQRIRGKWKGGLINEGGVISSEYGIPTFCLSDVAACDKAFPSILQLEVVECMRLRMGMRPQLA